MDDDDHDELLQCTDDDSLSESEDQCLPVSNQPATRSPPYLRISHTKLHFILIAILLTISSAGLIILLPLYSETINVKGDTYSMIYFTITFTLTTLAIATVVVKKFCPKYSHTKFLKPPLKCSKILKASVLYTISIFMVAYAVDRKRVMCHIQDPIKGIILVFSLIYYFFFCSKMMGLQRIFSTTTIIVGLFISVDYGLCDEFRCRGMERETRVDDAGPWSWQTHSIWTTIYIIGLALFSGFFTLMDLYLLPVDESYMCTSISSSFLSTVSRLVSSRDASGTLLRHSTSPVRPVITINSYKDQSVLHTNLWLHIFGWIFTTILFWTDLIPTFGKASNFTEFFNYTTNGFICHFKPPSFPHNDCGNVSLYSWLFSIFYVLFMLSSIRFLVLSQSAVFTVATMTIALPLSGIWWSIFKMAPLEEGFVLFSPNVTGELICALLGLPIVIIGIVLLMKSHFRDMELTESRTSSCILSTTPLA